MSMDEISNVRKLVPIILNENQKKEINYSHYEKLLDEAFADNEIKNIAVIGPYGSGKSTIWKTYEEEKNCLGLKRISLACFGEKGDAMASELEINLINQLIHQMNSESIKDTRFPLKREASKRSILMYSFLVMGLLIGFWAMYFDPFHMAENNVGFAAASVLLGMLVCLFILIYRIMFRQFTSPIIESLVVNKNEIRFAQNSPDDAFNQYVDELIYIFQKSGIHGLVLEDMDRFDNLEIFVKLRELNHILNSSYSKISKTPIRFVYMVKEDLWKSASDKAKFFDAVIPVVPVMDASNSYERLKNMFEKEKKEKLWNSLDKSFLRQICLHLSDLRTLKVVYVDFISYVEHLKAEEQNLNYQNLFAMVIYKNLFPKDYTLLGQCQGYVYSLFAAVEAAKDKKKADLDVKIAALEKKIVDADKEKINSIEELDALYYKPYKDTREMGYLTVDAVSEYDFASTIEFVKALSDAERVEWTYPSPGVYASFEAKSKMLTPKEVETIFAFRNTTEYQNRLESIKNKGEEEKEQIRNRINELRLQKGKVHQLCLADLYEEAVQIVQDKGADAIDSEDYPEIAEHSLMVNFLKNGYINERYDSYMTYFYPYVLTNTEQKYINKVVARESDAGMYAVPVSHPAEVIEHLTGANFTSPALPNYDIMEFLMKNDSYKDVREQFLINIGIHQNVEFVASYMEKTTDVFKFIEELFQAWEGCTIAVVESETLSDELKLRIMMNYLECNAIGFEEYTWEEECLFLEQHESKWLPNVNAVQMQNLYDMEYIIANLSFVTIPESMELCFSNGNFRITKDNIEYILMQQYGIKDTERIQGYNFTSVCEHPEYQLYSIVTGDMREYYINKIYLPEYLPHVTDEQEMILLLNTVREAELCDPIVKNMNVSISDLSQIDSDDITTMIVREDKMAFTKQNIAYYWKISEETDEELHAFLNEHYINGKCGLSFGFMIQYFEEKDSVHPKASKMAKDMISQDIDGYKNLVDDLNIKYSQFYFDTVTEPQLETAVGNPDTIAVTEYNLKQMRKQEKIHIFHTWIAAGNHAEQYVDLLETTPKLLSEDELHELIEVSDISVADRIRMVNLCSEALPIHENYQSGLVEAILDCGLFDGNYRILNDRYKNYGKVLKGKICRLFVDKATEVQSKPMNLHDDIFNYLMNDKTLVKVEKTQILAQKIPYLSLDQIKESMNIIGWQDAISVFEGKQPLIPAAPGNKKLLDALQKSKRISSYKIVDDNYRLYPHRDKSI